jgi:hypothetical protein
MKMSEKEWNQFAVAHSLDLQTGKKISAAEPEQEEPMLSRYELEQRLRIQVPPKKNTLWGRLFGAPNTPAYNHR